jgi:hypothetical protein
MLKAYKSKTINCDKISHGFYTRLGGVSKGIYSGLNLGLGSNDEKTNIHQNRALLTKDLQCGDAQLLTLYQIHSPDVLSVSSPWSVDNLPKADAMVTNKKGLMLGILTADCVPVLFADIEAGVIGASHAGWKGALGGILPNTINAMCQLGAKVENIKAVVGPAIAGKSYEVGGEVREAFLLKNSEFSQFFSENRQGKYQFNLCQLVMWLLENEGIESLDHINQDTYKNEAEFYSFRRTTHKKESDYGRQISVICIKG